MSITLKKGANRGGFALLFAVLTGSLLLAVGLAIFNIALKELDLSTAGRESQFAFYAADSGLECGLYYDGAGVFPDDSSSESFDIDDIRCAPNGEQELFLSDSTSDSALTVFKFDLPTNAGFAAPCAIVSVEKKLVSGDISTTIVSRGYNTCRAGAQQVERALQALY